ncbi:MAG TPA: hypothetical protein VGM81_11765 [Burkholderiaceae bacterium]
MSESESIPDDVRRFVLTSVPSVSYLEAMLIFRERAGAALTAADLAQALYIEPQAAETLMHALRAAGIIAEEDAAYRYAPSATLKQTVDRLAIAYPRHLLGITQLIHNATQQAAHQFASAFKWRKGK